jgi:hypothetical protein
MRNQISWAMLFMGLGMITFSLADASEAREERAHSGQTRITSIRMGSAEQSEPKATISNADSDVKSDLETERLLNRK